MTTETEVTVEIEPSADVPAVETETQEAPTEAPEAPPELTLEEKYRKAENKIRHDREKIAKARAKAERLAAEAQQYKSELDKLKSEREQKASVPQKPKMEDFDSVEDYVDAVATFRAKENIQQAPKEAVLSPQKQQEEAMVRARLAPVTVDANGEPMAAIDVEAAQFAAEVPDAADVFEEAKDILSDFPPHTQRLLLLAKNGPQAVYNLFKEGRLEYLGYLPPEIASIEIQQAASRAVKKSVISKAPAPVSAPRGTATGSKPLEAKSGKELLKWVNS